MGFLSSLWNNNPTDEERRAQAIRSGEAVPSRAERQRCWDARDNYFGCLDRINVIDAVEPGGAAAAKKACAKEGEQLEKDCAAEWVSSPSSVVTCCRRNRRHVPLHFFSCPPFGRFVYKVYVASSTMPTRRHEYLLTSTGRPLQKVPCGQPPKGAAARRPQGSGRQRGADQQRPRRLCAPERLS